MDNFNIAVSNMSDASTSDNSFIDKMGSLKEKTANERKKALMVHQEKSGLIYEIKKTENIDGIFSRLRLCELNVEELEAAMHVLRMVVY